MDDPLTLVFIGAVLVVLLLLFIVGRKRDYEGRPRWRKTLASSLWVANALLFGGVSDPVVKDKVAKVRKREFDDEKVGD